MPHLVLTDDDELFRESLGLNLADEGYEVTRFGNGRETLAYLQRAARLTFCCWIGACPN